jgi:hypothetical protein
VKQWLAERLQVLLPRLAQLGKDQEGEIQLLCEEEIAAWRQRPTMKSIRSLNTPMIDARNAIKEQLAVTPENSWLNPRSGEREHLARKYLNFSEAEWAAMHALTEQGRELRLEGQQLLNDPAALVARGAELLCSPRWEDIAVGLAVTTGRRLTEILKTAVFHPMSAYTVEFEGQLKQKAALLAPYEIPTLCEADLVIEATKRLRALLDCRNLDNREVERRYGPTVRTATHRHFQSLIPVRASDQNLYTHACRAVFGTLALYFFAPPVINALVYLATIQGHYWLLRSDTTEQQRRNYLSTMHYDDYKIGDGHGNIDGRQGIRLGEPGVKVLSVFAEAVVAQQQKEEREQMAARKQQAEQTLPVVKATKTGYSMLKPKQATAQRILTIMHERGLRHHDEVLSLLADTYRLSEQMEVLLAPLAETFGTSTPLETLKAIVDAEQKRDVAPSIDAHLQERWGATLEEVDVLFSQAAEQGEGKPVAYLREQLSKRTHYQQGPVKRQEHYQQLDFTQLSLAQLKAMRIPEATTERIRRAVAAIMEHNRQAQHDLDRWFIRAKEIKELVGGRGELIAAYLKEHQQEIAQHHQEFGLNEKYNNKPFPVTEAIRLEDVSSL